MPIMITKLRAKVDLMLTCSDASESGAGVSAAAGLTTYGVETTLALPKQLPPAWLNGFVLLSLFGGIEASRRALDLLGVTPLMLALVIAYLWCAFSLPCSILEFTPFHP